MSLPKPKRTEVVQRDTELVPVAVLVPCDDVGENAGRLVVTAEIDEDRRQSGAIGRQRERISAVDHRSNRESAARQRLSLGGVAARMSQTCEVVQDAGEIVA